MSIIKLSLKIVLPGRTLLNEQECFKNPEESFNSHSMVVEGKKHNKEVIHFQTRKSRPATQCLMVYQALISEDSYNHMTAKSLDAREDAQNCPEWSRPKDWFNLNQTQRLEAHLDRISKTVGGASFTFNVLDD